MGDIDYRARVNTALQEAEDLVSTYGAATAYQHLAAALRRLLETWPASGAR